jgi:hypothetical protein
MSGILVELSQQDGTTFGDGDYQVTIAPPITINDGDTIGLNKAFIDNAAASSGKFNIVSDLELSMTVGYYQQLVRDTYQDNGDGGIDGYATDPYFDGKTYILCEELPGAGFYLPGITVEASGDTDWYTKPSAGNSGSARFVQIAVTLGYTDPAGNPRQTVVDLSKYDWTGSNSNADWQSGEIDAIIIDKTKPVTFQGFRVISLPDQGPSKDAKVQFYQNNTQAIFQFKDSTNSVYKSNWYLRPHPSTATTAALASTMPYTKNTVANNQTITVPKGTYTPTDMAALINNEIQKDNATGGDLLDSTFLIKYNPTDYPNTIWVAEDRSAAFRTEAALGPINDGLLIGASQMSLAYDAERQKFYWEYLHMPYFFGTPPPVESTGFLTTSNVTAGDVPIAVTRNSGVFFTDLSATDENGDQVPFWDKFLGFDTENLIASNGAGTTGNVGSFDPGNLFLPTSLETGVKTTSGYLAISALNNLGADDQWWYFPAVPAGGYFANSVGQTVPIFAINKDLAAGDNSGFFLVSVDAPNNGEFRGADGYLSTSISAVVSNYYNAGSFTTGTADDALPYVHRGPPIMLSKFRVRILAPDKSLATDLGASSTIMLQVIRAEPASQPLKS